MATKNFISLENLQVYDSLIKSVINDGDIKSIKAAALNGKKLELYTVENPTAQDIPRISITLPFTQQEIVSATGKAIVWNEASGGGAKYEHVDGTWSAVCVNNGGENGITGQIYSVKKDENNKYVGTRINMTSNGFFYTKSDSSTFNPEDEIATLADLGDGAGSKTVYITETAGGSGDIFSKRYGIYQGAIGSSQNPSANEKLADIDIPKDLFVESGAVRVVTIAGEPYPEAQVGDYYIDIILANSGSEHIYIPANSLVDVYTAAQGASEIQLAINNNVISAEIVAVNGAKLVNSSVTRAKLATDVTDSLNLADTALQNEDINSVDEQDIRNLFL